MGLKKKNKNKNFIAGSNDPAVEFDESQVEESFEDESEDEAPEAEAIQSLGQGSPKIHNFERASLKVKIKNERLAKKYGN